MKILLINNRHFHGGGADIVYFNTGELLERAGHEVTYFSKWSDETEPCPDSQYFVPNNKSNIIRAAFDYFYNKDAAYSLERLLQERTFDIAHVHLIWGGLTASILDVLKRYRVPVVHSVHDYRMVCPSYTFKDNRGKICENCKNGHYINCALKRCSKGSLLQSILMAYEMKYRNRNFYPCYYVDNFIFVSYFCRDKHIEMDYRFSKSENEVIYNFPGNEWSHTTLSLSQEAYYLFYGRLSREKGVQTLLSVFKNFPNKKLKIVGTGPMEEFLKDTSTDNVEFLGPKFGDELVSIVKNAKFVCVPSEWYENNPMTIIESNTVGVPVIGARIGGIPEIIEDGCTGLLFDAFSTDSLACTIHQAEKMTHEDYLKMKRQCLLFANMNFDKSKYIERLLGVYERTIKVYKTNYE